MMGCLIFDGFLRRFDRGMRCIGYFNASVRFIDSACDIAFRNIAIKAIALPV
jgi:hypothetical protein